MSKDIANLVIRRNPESSFTRFGEEMLVVVPRTSWQIVLNGVGARMFELLDGKRTIGEVATELGREYQPVTPEQIVSDIDEILTDLLEKGAVQDVSAA